MTQLAAGLLPEYGNSDKNGLYLIPYGRIGKARPDTSSPAVGKKT